MVNKVHFKNRLKGISILPYKPHFQRKNMLTAYYA